MVDTRLIQARGCLYCAQIWLFYFDGTPICLLHVSSSWVKIQLYAENQLPMLSGSGLKVCGGVGGWCGWGLVVG